MAKFLTGLLDQLYGRKTPAPQAGNELTAPGLPYVQTGSWQFIDPPFFTRAGGASALTRVGSIAPSWQDWGQFGIGVGDYGGFFGAGGSNGQQVNLPAGTLLWFDPTTGQYYNLG